MKNKLVLYIGHPIDLAYFYRIIPILNKNNKYKIKIIFAQMNYFKEFENIQKLLSGLSPDYITIPEKKIPAYPHNIVTFGYNFFKTIYRIIFIKRLLKKYYSKNDILLLLDKSQLLSNIILSNYNKVILLQTLDIKDIANYFKIAPFITTVANLFNLFSNSSFVKIYKNIESKELLLRYKPVNPHYHAVYITKNNSLKDSIVLPKVTIKVTREKILIFGNRFNSWKFLQHDLDNIKKIIFDFYSKVYEIFPGYEFIYKPHPKEGMSEYEELLPIFNNSLINIGKSLSAELFLMQNRDIDRCFSIGSTASRSAYDMGFSSRVFFYLLPLKEGNIKMFETIAQKEETEDDYFIRKCDNSIADKCIKKNDQTDLHYLLEKIDELSNL